MAQFSEDVVHDFLFKTGLSDLVDDTNAFDDDDATGVLAAVKIRA